MSRKVLICGHRSFAARGLKEKLAAAGWSVTGLSRGDEGRTNDVVTGPMSDLARNPYLEESYDALVNFVILRNMTVAANVRFACTLLELCRSLHIQRMVQISSVSVYQELLQNVTENSPLKTDPGASGRYAAGKFMTDTFLIENRPADLRLVLLRAALILAPDMKDPLGSYALRLPGRKTLLIGSADSIRPVVTRELLHEAIERTLNNGESERHEVLLLVAKNSPTLEEYFRACVGDANMIRTSWPVWGSILALRALLRWPLRLQPSRAVRARRRAPTYDPAYTEERLGLALECDWRSALPMAP